ncbi:MAG TPA: glycosyltransferase [Gemmatimonadaceae bacterium]|nr:glycosyltransferase [Gemmatimonadaceae bacterium]
MRIFALDYEPASNRGGQELSLVDECVGLAARGHDVTLGYVLPGNLLARYEAAGVMTLRLSEIEMRPRARLRTAASAARSAMRAAATRPDVVCVNQYHDTLFGGAVAALARAPLVCHLRIVPPGGMCTQWRLGLPNVTRFIAASRTIADSWVALRGCDPSTIDVAHDGLDMDVYRPRPEDRAAVRAEIGVPDDAFLVLSAGRLDESKNLEGLLDAFALLRRDTPNAFLAIAGRPVSHASPEAGQAYADGLRAHAVSLGVADRVRWLGPRGDVPRLLSAADASALFSHFEALGRATFESLACGTPVVAPRNGGSVEILTGEFARWLFEPGHTQDAAALLASLVGWQDRDPALATRARRHAVEHFSISAKVDAVERSLARAVAIGPGRNGPRGEPLRRTFDEDAIARAAPTGAPLAGAPGVAA